MSEVRKATARTLKRAAMDIDAAQDRTETDIPTTDGEHADIYDDETKRLLNNADGDARRAANRYRMAARRIWDEEA